MKISKILSMAAIMSLMTTTVHSSDKTLGFDELYSNTSLIAEQAKNSNTRVAVNEPIEEINAVENLIKLSENEKIILINLLAQNGNINLSKVLSENISYEMLFNDKVFIIGKKNSDIFKILFVSRNLDLLATVKNLSVMARFIGKDSKWFAGGGEYQVCVKTEKIKQCHLNLSCRVVCSATAGGLGAAAGGSVGAGIAIGAANEICHDVCENVEDCQEITQCVEWR